MIRANLSAGQIVFNAKISGVEGSGNTSVTFSNLPSSAKYAIVLSQHGSSRTWLFVDLSTLTCINLDPVSPVTVSATYSGGTLAVTSSESAFESSGHTYCYPITGDVDYSAITTA